MDPAFSESSHEQEFNAAINQASTVDDFRRLFAQSFVDNRAHFARIHEEQMATAALASGANYMAEGAAAEAQRGTVPSGSSRHYGPKLNKPDEFKGERKLLPTFLFQMELKFLAEPSNFTNDATKVVYAISYLKGPAYQWVIPHQREGLLLAFPTYSTFQRKLKQAFGDVNEQATAERELLALRQRGPCSYYTTEFLRISSSLDWGTAALRSHYRMGLSDEVKDQLIHVDMGETLSDLSIAAENIDARIYERRQEKRRGDPLRELPRPFVPGRNYPSVQREPPGKAGGGRRYEPRRESVTPKASFGPIPMEIDAVQVTTRAPMDAKRIEQFKAGKCFKCDKTGHLARECPTGMSKN